MNAITGQQDLDAEGVRLRLANVRAGIVLTAFAAFGCGVYALATWNQPNRGWLTMLAVITTVSAPLIAWLPAERIIRSRWREPVFVAWSAMIIGLGAAATALDGGISSPMTIVLAFPVAFAALTYAPLSVAIVGALEFVALSVITSAEHSNADLSGFVIFVLLGTTAMCLWQALNRERQSAEITRARRDLTKSEASNRRRALQQQAAAAFGQRALAGAPIEKLMQDASSTVKRVLETDTAGVLEQQDAGFVLRGARGCLTA